MIEGLQPYSEYKESTIPWVGSIPTGWRVERSKRVFRKRKELNLGRKCTNVLSLTLRGVVNNDPDSPEGLVPKDYATYQMFRKNDLVFKLIDLENLRTSRVGLVHEDGIMSSAYLRLIPQNGGNVRYFYHQFFDLYTRAVFNALGAGVRSTLGAEDLGEIRILIPPADEQAAIVRFLDHANRKIDGVIRAKRKLIALLGEQKQAIIHRAVTRGLNPNAPLKPSGIPWLGDIPEHWEVRRLRTLVYRIEQGVSPQATGFLAEGDSWGVLKSGCVNHGVFRQTEHKQLAKGFKVDPSIVVKVGDVLISRACGSPNLVGSVGKVHSLDYKLILSDKTFRALFRPLVNADFMVYAMNCSYYRQQVEQAISGAEGMANNLPLSELRSFVFAVPPFDEAAAIALALDRELAQFTTAIARTEREIALMQEYRTRLTADVVTGKLDVRPAAANLPEPEPVSADDSAGISEDETEPGEIEE
jgi:type I restriction enzyme S subunit